MSTPQSLRVSIVQTALHWHAPDANRRAFGERLSGLRGTTDVVVLPEMFTTGFSMDVTGQAEPVDGPSIVWMRERAAELGAVVCGSLIIEQEGKFYNRFVWMPPDGQPSFYDKRHLFRMAGEDGPYAPGRSRLIVDYKGFRICPMVCYDLRFPVWSRGRGEFDLLLYVANWPTPRANAWRILLRARAIENLCFVAGVNRTGSDENGNDYPGDSLVCDFKGLDLIAPRPQEHVSTVTLDGTALAAFRERFPFHLDADRFEILEP